MSQLTWLPPNRLKHEKSTINAHIALHMHRKNRTHFDQSSYRHHQLEKAMKKKRQISNVADKQDHTLCECQALLALNAGRVNPFHIYTDDDLNIPYVNEILDYAVTYMWPQIVPGARSERQNPVRKAWMSSCMKSPMTMYSFLHGASENNILQTRGLGDTKHRKLMRLVFKIKAIKLINEEVSRFDAIPSDELLACICTLATYGTTRAEPTVKLPSLSDEIFAKSPLASTETLDVISNVDYVRAHMDALYVLVERKGGLENVRLYGLAGVLQGCDLLWSSVALTPPNWPWLLGDAPLPYDVLCGKGSPTVVGTGFESISLLGPCAQLQTAISQLATFVSALDNAFRQNVILDYLPQFVKARSKLHHLLLSLPEHSDRSGALPDEKAMYEVARISFLLFSFMAIFPLPQRMGIQKQLCLKLQIALRWCAALGLWRSNAAVLLWATVMGAINAPPELKAWYLLWLSIAREVTDLDLSNWETVLELLSRYIWWDHLCEAPALRVWDTVLTTRPTGADVDLAARKGND